MWPRLSHSTHVSSTIPSATRPAVMRMPSQPGAGRAPDVGRHLQRRDPARGADHQRGGRDGVTEEQQRQRIGLPPVGEPRPAPQLGRRPGPRGRGGERNGGRIEPLIEHVQDPDVDAGRDLRREADAVVGLRRVEGGSAVVTNGGLFGEVAQNQHGIHQVVAVLGQHGAHVGGGTPAAQQRRADGRRGEGGRAEIGDGGGHHLPLRGAGTASGDAGGPPQQRQEIAAVGLVAHGPQPVDGGLEDVVVSGRFDRRGRVEGDVLGAGHARRP